MNLDLLSTFLAVQKHLSYTEAGKEVFLSQPAVWRQIRKLEADLHVPLFERIGKSLALTDAGRTLAAEAEMLLGNVDRVVEAVQAQKGPSRGRLRIGASTTPGFYLLPSVLGRFHARYPDVELTYRVGNSQDIEEAILKNELDLGFVGSHVPQEEIHREPVVEDLIVFFSSPNHPLAARRRIPLSTLVQDICILREQGSATRKLVEAHLAAEGISIGRSITLGCPEAIKAVVAGGLGFSFLSIHGLHGDFRTGRLKKLAVARTDLRRTIECIWHAEKHISPVMTAFREAVGSARWAASR
jgi:DNA-binding transcriptional LysR family regulator